MTKADFCNLHQQYLNGRLKRAKNLRLPKKKKKFGPYYIYFLFVINRDIKIE